MKKTTISFLLAVGILALGAAGAAAMILSRKPPEKSITKPPAPPVMILPAQATAHEFIVSTEGTVVPRTETILVSELSGRVVHVSESLVGGGHFDKGDVLLEIDPRDYEVQIMRAEAQLAQARRALEIARSESDLAQREWDEFGKGEAPALVRRRPQLDEAESLLAAARADLAQARLNLERTRLIAPYAGRVRSKEVDLGQFVTRGAPLARIYAVDYVEIRLPLPSDELAYLDLPLPYRDAPRSSPNESSRAFPENVEVTLSARFAGHEHEWRGMIVRTEGEIDPNSRMIYAVARVHDPYRYVPPKTESQTPRPPLEIGTFVEARIHGRTVEGVFVVPRGAMRGRDELLIVDEENRIERRRVEIARAERENVVISDGLRVGERIVLTQLEAVSNGMLVRPLPATPSDPDTPQP